MRRTRLDPTKTGHEAEALEFGLRNRVIGQEEAIHKTALWHSLEPDSRN
jgi:hypothetical protein